jgi:hypothetical protein
MGNHGPSGQFSRNSQGPQGRTLYNQGPGNQHGQYSRLDRAQGHNLYNKSGGDHDMDFRHRGGDHDMDFRHRGGDHNNVGVEHNNFRHGIARGDFFKHGRHFHFRRFWHGEWVFLTGFDDCTAWAWVNVAPGVWAWSPIDVCIG